jgi:Anti-sigma-K factor rskA/Putative zinc-finger
VGAVRHECLVRPEDLGPFLLGQLPPDDEARVAQALAGCPSCAAEVRALRPVVTSLSLVTPAALAPPGGGAEVAAAPAPPEPRGSFEFDRLLASVRAERERRRGRIRRRGALVAAAAAVLLLAVGGVVFLGRDNTGSGADVTLLGRGGAQGTAVVQQTDWGTAIMLTVHGLPPGQYGAWLQDWSGKRAPAGTFKLGSDGTTHLKLSVLMRLDDAASIGVTQVDGKDVLTHDF